MAKEKATGLKIEEVVDSNLLNRGLVEDATIRRLVVPDAGSFFSPRSRDILKVLFPKPLETRFAV